jgi:hypothetical protein
MRGQVEFGWEERGGTTRSITPKTGTSSAA